MEELKNFRYLVIAAVLIAVLLGTAIIGFSVLQKCETESDVLFQISTIDALSVGVYDGNLSFKELSEHGDTGIGTFNHLDGEMVGLDGKFYQVRVDGAAYPVNDSTLTPFAMVTFFEADKTTSLHDPLSYSQLDLYLDNLLETKNIFYMIKINGVFEYIKTRSVPRQSKPYPPLAKAIQNQSTFEFHSVEGTMVGLRTPNSMKGVNVPGYHFHFITADGRSGGHLLDCRVKNVTIQVDTTTDFQMILPRSDEFYKADLAGENRTDLQRAER